MDEERYALQLINSKLKANSEGNSEGKLSLQKIGCLSWCKLKHRSSDQWKRISKFKELIDFALYSGIASTDKIKESRIVETTDNSESKQIERTVGSKRRIPRVNVNIQITETIRGFWSHHNARFVMSTFVPIFTAITIVIILVADIYLSSTIVGYYPLLWITQHLQQLAPFHPPAISLFLIFFNLLNPLTLSNASFVVLVVLLSIFIYSPIKRIRMEAYTLEAYLLVAREDLLDEMLRKLTEKNEIGLAFNLEDE